MDRRVGLRLRRSTHWVRTTIVAVSVREASEEAVALMIDV
jgi:hypothetical protein